MKTLPPSLEQIDRLLNFLPLLSAAGPSPIKKWHGGERSTTEPVPFPFPEYVKTIEQFFRAASADCWSDYQYDPAEVGQSLATSGSVEGADLNQIKTLLTYCVRGERFCDGFWGAMIEQGHIKRILLRLAELRAEMANAP